MLYSPRMTIKTTIIIISCALLSLNSLAQEHRASPLSIATTRYKDTYVKIVYSQPQKNGRDIFGQLVPYGAVWRTGANEATEMTVTTDIMINGQQLKAGTYSIFTIPNQNNWIVIINADLGLWGSYNYNPKRDVLRTEVPVQSQAETTEALTIGFDPRNNVADLYFKWDKTKVVVPIQFVEPKPKP